MCAFAYCDVWDIPDPSSRNIVLQVHAQYVLSLFLSKEKIQFKTTVNSVSVHCIPRTSLYNCPLFNLLKQPVQFNSIQFYSHLFGLNKIFITEIS